MIIEILKPYGEWKQGDTPDLTRALASQLVAEGIGRIHEDQTRRDYVPKPKDDAEPQQITVNNYYVTPDEVENPKKKFFNFKNKS